MPLQNKPSSLEVPDDEKTRILIRQLAFEARRSASKWGGSEIQFSALKKEDKKIKFLFEFRLLSKQKLSAT